MEKEDCKNGVLHSNGKGFVVIGAGLPRTGTSSLRDALEQVLKCVCKIVTMHS